MHELFPRRLACLSLAAIDPLCRKDRCFLESRRDQKQPQLQVDIEHLVMFYMDQSGRNVPNDTSTEALDALYKQGASAQKLIAEESISIIAYTPDGFRRERERDPSILGSCA